MQWAHIMAELLCHIYKSLRQVFCSQHAAYVPHCLDLCRQPQKRIRRGTALGHNMNVQLISNGTLEYNARAHIYYIVKLGLLVVQIGRI